jgi:PTH1 family peptidyl-tRNA hydrolase
MAQAAWRLVVGLGNPGPEYDGTRHNIGFAVTEKLAEALACRWSRRGRGRREARGQLGEHTYVLLQPQTYMNNSGTAVRAAVEDLGGEIALLVICDDFHLPLGRMRCRDQGSDGGQKGLASVIAALPERAVPRLRLGIGEPPEGVDGEDYVLRPFKRGEQAEVRAMVERAAELLRSWLRHGNYRKLIDEANANEGKGNPK